MLQHLFDADEDDVVVVYSQPDKPQGRGKKLKPTAVKALAESRGIEVRQPRRLRDGTVAQQLLDDQIDLAIVVAYGRILPKAVFEAPKFNTWNVHASLLPRHRGASPIQHSILTGDQEAGVTLMQLSEGMDEGDMLLKRALPIEPTDTGGSLFDKLALLGGQTLVEGLRLAKSAGLTVTPQNDAEATYASMFSKQDGLLDFARPAVEIERKVRAFDPWPGTFLKTEQGPLKIRQVRLVEHSGAEAPGTVLEAGKQLVVKTGEGALQIERLQPPGKKAMAAADYLRGAGRHISAGKTFPGC